MSKKMLIDAGHPEETRVVVVDGTKVEDFDFESASRRPIRGNIYLAKVTRVEPSLQAAFVEYGGNRHGFLAFNEIHPDYYQIPYEDRAALAAEEETAVNAEADAEPEPAAAEVELDESGEPIEPAESFGDDSDEDEIAEEKAARRSRQLYRKYKIQEVVKRRQILLVQVAKEERGNKGAALTTYLSLAGRYCVLMPNTPRGGGISRKIANVSDRKRLKSVVSELDLPKGIGLIIRTAGASRTKIEIRRDADYLLRLWENIRELTLKSVAPALIYEEGNLVKRAIRDLYDKDIDGVLVEGEAAYKEAKAFMRMLMPSHAKKVQHYNEIVPLYLQYQVESQLEAIYSPIAPLKSGGYIVINPTEALVSIDVNSGRSTRERNIETTAFKTNIEAAHEAARQMRLRDLAGLIVIDFIDMDESKNNRAVEKAMKDALKRDRARLQMGRISQFGLMEISRQRRRSSLIEGSTEPCPHCKGTGYVRSTESSALVALRGLEKEGMRGRAKRVRISLPTAIAIYTLNEKREHLLAIEERFQMRISVASDDEIIAPEFVIEPVELRAPGEELVIPRPTVTVDPDDAADQLIMDDDDSDHSDTAEAETSGRGRSRSRGKRNAASDTESSDGETGEDGTRRRRRRRRRKPSSEDGASDAAATETVEGETAESQAVAGEADDAGSSEATPAAATGEDGEAPRRRRRRGRRGGRSRRRTEGQVNESQVNESQASESQGSESDVTDAGETAPAPVTPDAALGTESAEAPQADAAEKPVRKRAPRRRKTAEAEAPAAAPETETAETSVETATEEEAPKRRTRRPRKTADSAPAAETAPAEGEAKAEKPKTRTRRKKADVEADAGEAETATTEKPAPKRRRTAAAKPAAKPEATEPAAEPAPEPVPAPTAETATPEPAKPAKRGWWNRTGLFGK